MTDDSFNTGLGIAGMLAVIALGYLSTEMWGTNSLPEKKLPMRKAAKQEQAKSDLVVLDSSIKSVVEELLGSAVCPIHRVNFRHQQMNLKLVLPGEDGNSIKAQARGTGIVISPKGYFVTAAHAIRKFVDSPNAVYIIYSRDKTFRGKIVAYSFSKDYALLQMNVAPGERSVEKQLSGFQPIILSAETSNMSYSIERLRFANDQFYESIRSRGLALTCGKSIKVDGRFVRPACRFSDDLGAVVKGDSGTPVYDLGGSLFGQIVSVSPGKNGDEFGYVAPILPFLEELVK